MTTVHVSASDVWDHGKEQLHNNNDISTMIFLPVHPEVSSDSERARSVNNVNCPLCHIHIYIYIPMGPKKDELS